jgi:hypothetical protein
MKGEHTVSGPGTEGRQAPSAGVALSLAQTLASRPGAPEGTWYVRGPGGQVAYHVTKADRVIFTTPVEHAEPRKRHTAPAMTLSEVA